MEQKLDKVHIKLDDAVVRIQDILQEIQNLKNETKDSQGRETKKIEEAIKIQTQGLRNKGFHRKPN